MRSVSPVPTATSWDPVVRKKCLDRRLEQNKPLLPRDPGSDAHHENVLVLRQAQTFLKRRLVGLSRVKIKRGEFGRQEGIGRRVVRFVIDAVQDAEKIIVFFAQKFLQPFAVFFGGDLTSIGRRNGVDDIGMDDPAAHRIYVVHPGVKEAWERTIAVVARHLRRKALGLVRSLDGQIMDRENGRDVRERLVAFIFGLKIIGKISGHPIGANNNVRDPTLPDA